MQHRYSTRFVAMLQNKLDVFVAHWVISIPYHGRLKGIPRARQGIQRHGGDAYNWNSEGMVGGGG